MIDAIINDLNEMLKALLIGQHLQACAILTGITQKLFSVRSDMKAKDETLEKLKQELRKRGVDIIDVPAEELEGESNE